jgi:hypothetical protein
MLLNSEFLWTKGGLVVLLSPNAGNLRGRVVGYEGCYGLMGHGVRKGAKYGWRDTDVVAF